MAESRSGSKRSSADVDSSTQDSKRVKMGKGGDAKDSDRLNPYLAHHYQDDNNGQNNGFGGPLDKLERHKTTAAQAAKAEDSDLNPWTGQPHSQRYFDILKTRRNLPVCKQRQEFLDMYHKNQ